MNIVLINAAGNGLRFQNNIPKQFCLLNNKPILYYSLNLFENSNFIDKIYIITQNQYFELVNSICKEFNINKFCGCIEGADTANMSRYMGLNSLKCNNDDLIIMHDAVRICVKNNTLEKLIELGLKYGVSICGQTINANIFLSNNDNCIYDRTFPSQGIFINSMPFVCKYDILKNSFDKGISKINDSAGPMGIVGEFGNVSYFPKVEMEFIETLKITYNEDINFLKII